MNMSYISAEIPLFIGDVLLPATLEMRVWPVYDQAFRDNAADDVQVYGADDKWHTVEDHYAWLAMIEKHDPAAYADIVSEREAQAEPNYEEQDA
jgi:hypothetical protein